MPEAASLRDAECVQDAEVLVILRRKGRRAAGRLRTRLSLGAPGSCRRESEGARNEELSRQASSRPSAHPCAAVIQGCPLTTPCKAPRSKPGRHASNSLWDLSVLYAWRGLLSPDRCVQYGMIMATWDSGSGNIPAGNGPTRTESGCLLTLHQEAEPGMKSAYSERKAAVFEDSWTQRRSLRTDVVRACMPAAAGRLQQVPSRAPEPRGCQLRLSLLHCTKTVALRLLQPLTPLMLKLRGRCYFAADQGATDAKMCFPAART